MLTKALKCICRILKFFFDISVNTYKKTNTGTSENNRYSTRKNLKTCSNNRLLQEQPSATTITPIIPEMSKKNK